jgi:hypothetical protein
MHTRFIIVMLLDEKDELWVNFEKEELWYI